MRLAMILRAHHAADVRRNHHQVIVVVALGDVAGEDRRREEVVGRDVEEALDLPGVEVDGEHAVGAGRCDHVRHELRGDRRAGERLPVLPGIAVIGDDRGDPAGRRAAERVDDDQKLHQIVVRRKARRLHDEDILAAHVFLDLDEDLLIGEAADGGLREVDFEILGDRPGEGFVGVPGDDLHVSAEVPGGAQPALVGALLVEGARGLLATAQKLHNRERAAILKSASRTAGERRSWLFSNIGVAAGVDPRSGFLALFRQDVPEEGHADGLPAHHHHRAGQARGPALHPRLADCRCRYPWLAR